MIHLSLWPVFLFIINKHVDVGQSIDYTTGGINEPKYQTPWVNINFYFVYSELSQLIGCVYKLNKPTHYLSNQMVFNIDD